MLLLVALVLPGAACAGRGWLRDHPEVAARARAQPGSFVPPARAQWRGVTSLGASYTMRVTRGIGGRTLDLYITAQPPANIDILVLAPTGLIEAYLRANEREVGMFVREDEVLYAAPASPDAFERALGLGLSAADAVATLIGYGVDESRLPPGRPVWDARARRVRVDYGQQASAWLHPLTLRFDRTLHRFAEGFVETRVQEWRQVPLPGAAAGSAGSQGALRARPAERADAAAADTVAAAPVQVQDLQGLPDRVPVPSLLQLSVQPEGYGVRLRVSGEISLNLQLPADAFELQRIPGIVELPLSELSQHGGLFRRSGG